MKGGYAVYMAFKKCSYYCYNSKAAIKCDDAPLQNFPTTHILSSKVNNWELKLLE